MKLFFIQDADRPMHVIAEDWQDALEQWKRFVALESELPVDAVAGPQGIHLVAEDHDLIDQRARLGLAEETLRRADWTHIEGAPAWKPPLGRMRTAESALVAWQRNFFAHYIREQPLRAAMRDHACSACFPGADTLVEGYVCPYHLARIIADTTPKPTMQPPPP